MTANKVGWHGAVRATFAPVPPCTAVGTSMGFSHEGCFCRQTWGSLLALSSGVLCLRDICGFASYPASAEKLNENVQALRKMPGTMR